MSDDFDFDSFFNDLKSGLDDDSPFVEVEPRQEAPEQPQEPRKAPARETAPRKREAPPAANKRTKKKSSPIRGVICLAVIVIALVLIVKSCGGSKEEAAPVEATQAPVAEEVAETEAPQADQAVLSAEACDSIVKATLASTWGDDYNFERDDNLVTIKIWSSGVTADAVAAQQGNEAVLTEWNTAIDNMLYLTNQVQDVYKQNGNGDTLVSVFLLNDVNKDNTLAITAAGVVMYDAVNNINLIG